MGGTATQKRKVMRSLFRACAALLCAGLASSAFALSNDNQALYNKLDEIKVQLQVNGSVAYNGPLANQLPASLGQKTAANSESVVLASDQTAITVTGQVQVGSAPVNPPLSVSGVDSGGLKRHILTGTDGTVKTDSSATTQPVSVTKGPTGAANFANGQVAASTTAATLVAARATRRSVAIKNTSTTITVYYGAATVTNANGVELKPGESQSIDTTALIQVIAASGTPVVAYVETYD